MMLVASLALGGLLWLGPPAQETPAAEPEPTLPAYSLAKDPEAARYQGALDQLARGIALASEHPAAAAKLLEEVLETLSDFAPRLATDPRALELRADAQLALARAYLLAGDAPRATRAMDEALRSALGEPLPVDPDDEALTQLWRARSRHAEGHPASPLVINCSVPCRVYIDERRVNPDLPEMPAGSYRLWVEAEDGSLGILRGPVEIAAGEESLTIEYRAAELEPERLEPDLARLGLVFIGVGTGVLLSGVVALSVGLTDEPHALGAAMGACPIGGASMLVGGILTGVGLHRRERTGLARVRVAPSFAWQRGGGQLGVSLSF